MSLNAIIKHLELTEQDAYARNVAPESASAPPACSEPEAALNEKEREYAERVFFEKYLKECNPGMSDKKIQGRIAMSIAVARMLYKEIYGS